MNKRIYTNEKIRFGKHFIIRGAQFENIDNEFSAMTDISIQSKKFTDTGKSVLEERQFMVETDSDWHRLTKEISNLLIEQVSRYRETQEWGSSMTPLKDIVTLKIEYTGSGKLSTLSIFL